MSSLACPTVASTLSRASSGRLSSLSSSWNSAHKWVHYKAHKWARCPAPPLTDSRHSAPPEQRSQISTLYLANSGSLHVTQSRYLLHGCRDTNPRCCDRSQLGYQWNYTHPSHIFLSASSCSTWLVVTHCTAPSEEGSRTSDTYKSPPKQRSQISIRTFLLQSTAQMTTHAE